MIEEKNANHLWLKYKSGKTTEAENQLIEQWFHELNNDEPALLSDSEIEEAHQQMHFAVHRKIQSKKVKTILWPRFVGAAAILLAVVGLSLLVLNQQELSPFVRNSKILPGGNKATLTLANGTVIDLNDAATGELATETGIAISKTADGELVYTVQSGVQKPSATTEGLNIISTPRGGQYQVNLPDGTKVWLNAASYLKFSPDFSKHHERKVVFSGEAYFEVAKSERPFVVVTGQQEVKVLGTHFNINGYTDDETISTTLIEGAVRVINVKTNKSSNLTPGQQNVLKGNRMDILKVDAEEAIAWKNGYFTFINEPLESIMRKISRWYDVDIDGDTNPALMQKEFSGTVSRFGNVSDVLEMLELTDAVHFKIEGRRIIIMK